MSTVEQIEDAVRRLSPQERAAFRSWYAEFDGQEWDRQIEADLAGRKLDWLVQEAREDNVSGRSTAR